VLAALAAQTQAQVLPIAAAEAAALVAQQQMDAQAVTAAPVS
jgi:hypothetical protein